MRELVLISVVPDGPGFWYQTAVNLYNQRKYGTSKYAHVLIFIPRSKQRIGISGKWKFLENKFPEVKFFCYEDDGKVEIAIESFDYPPLCRPYCLQKHFQKFPKLVNAAIYYHDSDTIFTNPPNFLGKYKDDDVNYMSDTRGYINSDYFESKIGDVDLHKLLDYKKIDVLETITGYCHTTKQQFIDRKEDCGGAQYLLKNINAKFWSKVFNACIEIRLYLSGINQKYFPGHSPLERENKGFQSFCSDMWALLFLLIGAEMPIKIIEEMNFSHATDKIETWNKNGIYHDAGAPRGPIIDELGREHFLFYKKGQFFPKEKGYNLEYAGDWEGSFALPFDDDLSFVSPAYCSKNYINELQEAKKFLQS